MEAGGEESGQKSQEHPHPLAEVPGGGREEEVHAVACEAAQVVASESTVAFQMTDDRLDRATPAEALSHSLALALCLFRGRAARHKDLGAADMAGTAVAAIDNGLVRSLRGDGLGLIEHLGQPM